MLEKLMFSSAELSNAMLRIIIKVSASKRTTFLNSLLEEAESYSAGFKAPRNYFSGFSHIIVQVKQHCTALEVIIYIIDTADLYTYENNFLADINMS